MGFRKDLDLDAILNKARWGTSVDSFVDSATTAGVRYITPRDDFVDPMEQYERPPAHQYQNHQRDSVENPVKMGRGSPLASPTVALAIRPIVCWDVNGYYGALGVHWKATRKELREAYQSLNGQNSVYLTYVLKQLLNDEIRYEYDCMPLGEQFLNDDYVQDALKAKAAEVASRRSKEGRYTTPREVVEEQYRFIPEADEAADGAPDPEMSDPDATVTDDGNWPWPYYVWRTFAQDTAKLSAWQTLLVSAMAERGFTGSFAVGLFGRQPHRVLTGWTEDNLVIYLSVREDATQELAEHAVDALMST